MVKLTENLVYSRTKSALENVRKLNLWGCDIDDISVCSKMHNLEVLSLSLNQIGSLEPLVSCAKLRELYLRKNNIETLNDLEYLKGLPALRVLWLDENPCASLADYRLRVVRALPRLAVLDSKGASAGLERVPTAPADAAVTADEVAMAATAVLPPLRLDAQSPAPMDVQDYGSCHSDCTPTHSGYFAVPISEVAFYNPQAPPSMLSTSLYGELDVDMPLGGGGGGGSDAMSASWHDFACGRRAPNGRSSGGRSAWKTSRRR